MVAIVVIFNADLMLDQYTPSLETLSANLQMLHQKIKFSSLGHKELVGRDQQK